jgi:hypothetical protein
LYFPTFVQIKHDLPAKKKYQRLKDKKGIPMVAAVAQQRKLLGLMYTLWKKQDFFLWINLFLPKKNKNVVKPCMGSTTQDKLQYKNSY